jgi:hypothetical protein
MAIWLGVELRQRARGWEFQVVDAAGKVYAEGYSWHPRLSRQRAYRERKRIRRLMDLSESAAAAPSPNPLP